MDNKTFSALTPTASQHDRDEIAETLSLYTEPVLAFVASHGTTIRVLDDGERYADVSRELSRLGIDVDSWPAPPAGLFVVQERCVYLRRLSPMTVAHEFAHALDCSLGGGIYISGTDSQIRTAFASARRFVSPYAASGLDEYFAESVRAYVGANEASSPWPNVSRDSLRAVDQTMFDILTALFGRLNSGQICNLDALTLQGVRDRSIERSAFLPITVERSRREEPSNSQIGLHL